MRNKGFWKVWIFSLIGIAVAGLMCSSAFGQFSQTFSSEWGNLLGTNTLNSSISVSPFAQSTSYDSTSTSPFSTVSNQYSSYNDLLSSSLNQASSYQNLFSTGSTQFSSNNTLLSTSWDQSNSYQNAFGFGSSSGSNFYADPLYTTGGGYVNVGAPGSLYSSEYDWSKNPLGGSNYSENSLILPWTTYSSNATTSYGMDAWPYTSEFAGSSIALGTPTIYSGFGRVGEGIGNLVSYAPISAQLDQTLANRPMYTAEGMPFYATASYFNPYNASNYYFAPGAKTSAVGIAPGGYVGSASVVTGAASGYPGGGYGGYPGVGGGVYYGAGGGYPGIGGGVSIGGGTGSPASGIPAGGFSPVVYGII